LLFLNSAKPNAKIIPTPKPRSAINQNQTGVALFETIKLLLRPDPDNVIPGQFTAGSESDDGTISIGKTNIL
jgi:hypothetical protein